MNFSLRSAIVRIRQACKLSNAISGTSHSSITRTLDSGLLSLRSGAAPVAVLQTRSIQWPSRYIDPYPTKEELEPVINDEEKLKELAFQPIKAAGASRTTSVFYDPLIQRYINIMTRFGEMSLARRLIHDTMAHIKRFQLAKYWAAKTDEERAKIELNPVKIFHQAINNCRPVIVTKKIKRGGAYYNVPYPLTPERSLFLAIKWMNDEVKERPKPRLTHYPEELAREMLRAVNFEGKVYKRKVDMHKQAEQNKAYAHYRWG